MAIFGYPSTHSCRKPQSRLDFLEKSVTLNLTSDQLDGLVSHARTVGREKGIDTLFKKHDINVLIGPAESSMTVFAATAGTYILAVFQRR